MTKTPRISWRRRFLEDQQGSLTAESVLWVPVYMIFLVLIVDVSLIFHGTSKAMRVAQDANRHASTGYLVTDDQLESLVAFGIGHFAPNAVIDASIGTETVATTIEIPVSDLEAVGLFGGFSDITVTFSTIHLLEI